MTLVLNLKPQLEQHLQKVADERGLSVSDLLMRDLEERWLSNPLAAFSSVGLGESNLEAVNSKAWLKEHWNENL
jgi:hypothetical protein